MVQTLYNNIVFTDLDGTLLDSDTYSYEPALPALKLLDEKNIPVILCSSKTHSEIDALRQDLKLDHPFISENGSAIFIPENYFNKLPTTLDKIGKYLVLILGKKYPAILSFFNELCEKQKLQATGFNEMSLPEISHLTGLDESGAIMAKNRSFSEPFIMKNGKNLQSTIYRFAENSGFKILKGNRFYHLLGNSDKGKAARVLTELYLKNNTSTLQTIGLGDSPNDFDLLNSVDIPVLVKKRDGSYSFTIDIQSLLITKNAGPEGWNEAIYSIFQ